MCRLYIAGRRLYPFFSVYSLGSQVAAVSANSQFTKSWVLFPVWMHTSHMCEFLTTTFEVVSVLCLDSILDGAGHWIVNAQDRALHELDFSSCVSLQCSRCRCLPLPPSFGRACFAPWVWRGWPPRDTIGCARIVQRGASKTTTSTAIRIMVRRHVRGSIGIIGLCQIV